MIFRIIFAMLFIFLTVPAMSICVKSEKAFLRSGPGFKYPITWVVGRYMPLLRTDQRNGWYKVRDVDNEEHWVSAADVSLQMSCLVVKASHAVLRNGPGVEYELAEFSYADRYSPFHDLLWDEGWYEIEDDDGNHAWIAEDKVWKAREKLKVDLDDADE